MHKLSTQQWVEIQSKWQGDPSLSFSDLAREYHTSRQVVSSKAKRECWKKTGNIVDINSAAKKKADRLTPVDDNLDSMNDNIDSTTALKSNVDVDLDLGFDTAVDRRAEVLIKHRNEVVALDAMQLQAKTLFNIALEARMTAKTAKDAETVKVSKALWYQAKIASDCVKDHVSTVKCKHEIERKCWDMDVPELSQNDLECMTETELTEVAKGRIPARFIKYA